MADSFEIVSQTPTSDIGETGTVVPAMEVRFKTKPSGVGGRLTLPLSVYTPDAVATAVATAAATLEAVQHL